MERPIDQPKSRQTGLWPWFVIPTAFVVLVAAAVGVATLVGSNDGPGADDSVPAGVLERSDTEVGVPTAPTPTPRGVNGQPLTGTVSDVDDGTVPRDTQGNPPPFDDTD